MTIDREEEKKKKNLRCSFRIWVWMVTLNCVFLLDRFRIDSFLFWVLGFSIKMFVFSILDICFCFFFFVFFSRLQKSLKYWFNLNEIIGIECCSNNGVTHSSQPCFSLCLSSLLHSLSKLCSLLFFWVTFDLENYDSFIHFVLWQCFYDFFFSFCFVTMWNMENIFFVYTWIWFDIWCLLLIKAIFFF